MPKKSAKSKKTEEKNLEKFSKKLTESMKENLAYNLEHPEEYEKHEEEVERALDEVMRDARTELKNLVSHCGLYCGACRPYLMLKKGLLERRGYKVGCKGCWVQNKNCAFILKKCPRLRKKEIEFCFECDRFPCEVLKPLDTRYRKNYGVSLIKNLERMREIGVEEWAEEQQQFYKCKKCGGDICVHDDECFDCGDHYNPNKI